MKPTKNTDTQNTNETSERKTVAERLLDDRHAARGRLGSVRSMLAILAERADDDVQMALHGCVDLVDRIMDENVDTPQWETWEANEVFPERGPKPAKTRAPRTRRTKATTTNASDSPAVIAASE